MYGIDALSPDFMESQEDRTLMGGPNWDTFLPRLGQVESRGGQLRSNPLSSATGMYHFIPKTWAGVLKNYPDLGLTPQDINDDEKQAIAAKAHVERELIPTLRRALGREPTEGEIYAAWGLGGPDAARLFGADPNTPAHSLFRPAVAKSNPDIFYQRASGEPVDAAAPRTAGQVAAEYARRWNGARPGTPQGAAPMRDDPDGALESLMNYRPSQGIAAFAGGRPQMPQQPAQGLDALNPAMQLAGQLMPQRRGMDWTDALLQGGAAMMASRRPDFLGALGEGVGRGHQTFMAGEDQRYKDQVDRMGLGLKLHTALQKDTGEWAVSDGVQYNKKTGETRQVGVDKPTSDLGKLHADFQAGRIPQEVYEAELQKRRGETESPIMKVIREMGLPPDSPEAQSLIRKYADRVGTGAQVNIDQKAQSEEDKAMGKALGEQYIKYIDGGDAARQNNDRIDRLDQLLDGVSTGKFAGSLMELQRGLHAVLGKDAPVVWGRPAEVAQAEAAKALSNELALMARSPAGGAGMPGAMSDADREFLKSMVPGMENTPEGRKMMISTIRRINQRQIEVAEMADAWREEKGTIRGFSSHLGKWAKANPLFPAKTEPPQAAPAPGGPPLAPNAPTTPQDRQSIAPQIRRMSMDELKQLSPNGMSPEERAEAERRWDELKQQSIQSIPGGTP